MAGGPPWRADFELTTLDGRPEPIELEVEPVVHAGPTPRLPGPVPAPERRTLAGARFWPLGFMAAVLLGAAWLLVGGAARRAAALALLAAAAIGLRRAGGFRGASVTWGALDLLLAPLLCLGVHLGTNAASEGWRRLRPPPPEVTRAAAIDKLRARLVGEGAAERVVALEPTVPRGATLNVDGQTLLLESRRCDQAHLDAQVARASGELRQAGIRYLRCARDGRLFEAAIRP